MKSHVPGLLCFGAAQHVLFSGLRCFFEDLARFSEWPPALFVVLVRQFPAHESVWLRLTLMFTVILPKMHVLLQVVERVAWHVRVVVALSFARLPKPVGTERETVENRQVPGVVILSFILSTKNLVEVLECVEIVWKALILERECCFLVVRSTLFVPGDSVLKFL